MKTKPNIEGALHEDQVLSFSYNSEYINLYTDKAGTDVLVKIPMWMFVQIANEVLTITTKKEG